MKGTIIGFLSETDVDKAGNAAFISTKTGQPSKLFHIALDEKDKDNDTIVVDLEEWEIDEYCEWIAEAGKEEQKKQQMPPSKVHGCDKKGSSTITEFDMLNNLALEAAASVNHVPVAVETPVIDNVNAGKATLAEAAAAGCTKCRKELNGIKAKGPHVGHCPRRYPKKRERAGNGCKDKSLKRKDNIDSQTNNETVDVSSRKSVAVAEVEKNDNNMDNTITQSRKNKNDSGSRGMCKNNQDQARELASKPCPSFNDILKTALASYSSNTRKKHTNNSLPPVPPPFLSHEENCTIRTALAFVLAKAKNKERSNMSLPSRITPEAVENTMRRVSTDAPPQTDDSGSQDHSPLLGGLLALPPRDCAPIGQMNLNESNSMIVLERELKHVRDVMNLAVSALLPLYKSSTLNAQSNQTQRQCAVYDYESAAKPSSERHLASFDGLCRHIIGRLSSIVNDEALRRKLANESPVTLRKGSCHDDQMDLSINASEEEGSNDIVRDAVAQLQMDFMFDSFRHSSKSVQQIHQILASCHVLHRLLLLDENCTSIGSDCVAVACTILTDLYHDKCIGGTIDGESSTEFRQLGGFEAQNDKEKHQVVPSRWSYNPSSYIVNREERRTQAVYALSQQCHPSGPSLIGMKRPSSPSQNDESSDYQPMQLPRLGDVLAVNLLRLLEGASAIRLHFHRRYTGQNSGFVARKIATSAAAAEVLQEIRSKTDDDLLMPIHTNDAASIYYHETLNTQDPRAGKVYHLRPGAKMMLRIHLFGLIQKLSIYEQG